VAIDVGAGDGRAVLAAAARDPRTLHLGLDPVAPGMAEASRRAARRPARGGLTNVRFVVGAAESYPGELRRLAAAVTVRFPWASLLRGCLGGDAAVATGVAALLAPGGSLELLLAPAGRDRIVGIPTDPEAVIAAARATFERLGLSCVEGRPATPAEVRSSGSTWARRLLGAGSDRAPVVVRFRSP